MADPDAALMEAFQRGDEAAFEALVDRHRQRVLRLAYRYLGDEAAAEDLAQETFLRIYRSRRTWQPTARFSTWLYRVTANACLNEIRARRARRGVEATAPATDADGGSLDARDDRAESPPDAALRAELAGEVRRAVAALPEDQRMAVLLNKYEGLSYQDLADAMGRSVPAVKSLLVRARASVRRSLEPYLGLVSDAEAGTDEPDDVRERTRRERRERRAAPGGGENP